MTYSNNIRQEDMFDVYYLGIPLMPSTSAMRELMRYGLGVENCKEILEEGYFPRKRAKDTIEAWFDIGKKTYNVVVVKTYNFMLKRDIYLITHVGRFTKRK